MTRKITKIMREIYNYIYTYVCAYCFFGMFWLPPKGETHGTPQSLVSMVKHEYQIEKRERESERERERESAGSRNILVGHTQVSRSLDTCLQLFGSIDDRPVGLQDGVGHILFVSRLFISFIEVPSCLRGFLMFLPGIVSRSSELQKQTR